MTTKTASYGRHDLLAQYAASQLGILFFEIWGMILVLTLAPWSVPGVN